jgi:uncharacterized SAM-binding protein YcdF (DUF218 family)
MSLLFCLLLLAVALACHSLNALRIARACAVIGAALIGLVGLGLAPAVLLPATQMTNRLTDVTWADRSTIVILGAGTVGPTRTLEPAVPAFGYSRVDMGAKAWLDCRAHGGDCHLIVSGGDPQHHGAAEAVIYARDLVALGVPASAIAVEPRSRNTWQNAAFSTALIPAGRQVVVVTSGVHLKRSLLFFDHFRPGTVGIASDRLEPSFGVLQTGYNFLLMDVILHEEIGIVQFHLYNALGLNRGQ